MRTTNLRTLAGLLGGNAALALAPGGCPPPEGGGVLPKTNYTIAYISPAYGANLGGRFETAGRVTAADPAVIQAIMDARAKLAAAGPTAPGWTAFRAGNYMAAGN